MGEKSFEAGKAGFKEATDDIRVDLAWEVAKAVLKRGDVPIGSSKPDFDKIRKAVAAAKKEMAFRIKSDGRWITVEAVIGSKVVDKVVTTDLAEGGDQKKWRARLEALKGATGGALVNDADLKAFDQKHPDPDKAAKLDAALLAAQKAVELLKLACKRKAEELKAIETQLKAKATELQQLEKARKSLGN